MRAAIGLLGIIVCCSGSFQSAPAPLGDSARREEIEYGKARAVMIAEQIASRGVKDSAALDAMRAVPRHLFVPPEHRQEAYEDYPLAIGYDQTISQPFIVGVMTEALQLSPRDRVLEIGTGSGYQTAVLAEIAQDVFTIEIIDPLGRHAESTLVTLGYKNVHVKIGDGYRGWPEYAPFDAIVVTAAPDHIPQPLVDQLAMNGRMVLPLGDGEQTLVVLRRTQKGIERKDPYGVRFVPMTGEAQKHGQP